VYVGAPSQMGRCDMPTDEQQTVKLHYIDGVRASLVEAGRLGHVVAVLLIALSTITACLSLGAVSVDQKVPLVGIAVKVPVPLLLLGLTCATVVLAFFYVALTSYSERLRREIVQQYESLGFVPQRAPLELGWSAFAYPDAFTVGYFAIAHELVTPYFVPPLVAALRKMMKEPNRQLRPMERVAAILIGVPLFLFGLVLYASSLLVVVFPLLAEALALRYVALHQGASWLLVIVILAVAVLNIGTWLFVVNAGQDNLKQAFAALREMLREIWLSVQEAPVTGTSEPRSPDDIGTAAPHESAPHEVPPTSRPRAPRRRHPAAPPPAPTEPAT
jgi:hypothetical protein